MFDRQKFKELVHYVIYQRRAAPSTLGAVKLNKILWRCDFDAYYRLGESITGARYVRRTFGPVPHQILPILDELERDGVLRVSTVEFHGKHKTEFEVHYAPSPDSFSAEEKEIIDEAIRFVCDEHTAASISLFSHDEVWKAAEDGEEIPYATVFARPGQITEDEREWARLKLENALP